MTFKNQHKENVKIFSRDFSYFDNAEIRFGESLFSRPPFSELFFSQEQLETKKECVQTSRDERRAQECIVILRDAGTMPCEKTLFDTGSALVFTKFSRPFA